MIINEQITKYNVFDIAEYIVNVSYRYSWRPYYLNGEKLTKILQVIQMYFSKILHKDKFESITKNKNDIIDDIVNDKVFYDINSNYGKVYEHSFNITKEEYEFLVKKQNEFDEFKAKLKKSGNVSFSND